MDPAAAEQLRALGFIPPPAGMPDEARRQLIRRTVAARLRTQRRAARLIAARVWWAPAPSRR